MMRSDMFLVLLIALVSIGKSNEVTVKDVSNLSSVYLNKKRLAIGDTLELSGIASMTSSKFGLEGSESRSKFVKVSWGTWKGKGAKIQYTDKAGKEAEYEARFIGLEKDQKFKVAMVFLDAGLAILVNGDPVGAILPYALQYLPLSEVTFLLLPRSLQFTEMRISSNSELYQKYNDFKEMVNKKAEKLSKALKGKSVPDIREYANSGKGSVDLLQWKVYTKLLPRCGLLDLEDATIKWVLNNQQVMEMLLTSGDNYAMKKSIEILANLVRKDPALKTDSGWKIKWAVGLSIAASRGTWSSADYANTLIDPYQRYEDYLAWAAAGILYEPFFKGTAWHLSMVAESGAQDGELEWVRGKIPAEFQTPEKVVGCKLIKYHKNFDYHGEPRTLKTIIKYGSACGGISSTASSIGSAYGVPAMTLGQPGHCAYVVRVNEKWQQGNTITTWSNSTVGRRHSLWHNRNAAFIHVMEACQMKLPKYVLSEKMRLAAGALDKSQKFAILSDAIDICPENFGLWQDLKTATVPKRKLRKLREKADAMIATVAKTAVSCEKQLRLKGGIGRSGIENMSMFTEKMDNVFTGRGPVTDNNNAGDVEDNPSG